MGLFDEIYGVASPLAQMLGAYGNDVLSGRVAASGMPGSTYDPNRSFAQNALDPQGIENAMNMALGFAGNGLGIKAYHASPYDFEKFDVSKIGSGQGAQSYGHGIYAAESPAVSGPKGAYDMEFTAKNLGKPDLNQGEAQVLRMLRDNATDMDVIGHLAQNGYSFDEALKTLNNVKGAKSKIYEVNINADPSSFLDWDKPLSQQPHVQAAFDRLGAVPGPRWEVLPNTPLAVGGDRLPPASASQALAEQGIPGIRYLDQGSRGTGSGSSNYVVFDPSIIEILRKYGLAGAAVPTAAATLPYGDQQ